MDPLAPYGWDDEWRVAFEALAQPGDRPARISLVRRINCAAVSSVGGGATIETVVPSPRLSEIPDGASLPAVGDWVVLTDDEDAEVPVVVAILPRRSVLSRLDPADITGEQVLATNIDVLLVMQGLDTEVNLRRLERAMVLAFQAGARPIIVLTKADLVGDEVAGAAVAQVERRLRSLDVEVVATSTVTDVGLDRVQASVGEHGSLALIGPSGAGKSTLVNALVGAGTMAVGDVRVRDAKGRHTTVTRELWPLPGGGVVVDTPGLRGVGLWEADLGVDLAFPDVFGLAEDCKFADCSHDHEPGCAVQAAVAAGELDAGRVAHYRDLVAEILAVDERRVVQERAKGERGRQSRGQQTGRRVSGRSKKR